MAAGLIVAYGLLVYPVLGAAVRLGVYEDPGLAVAALTVLLVLIGRSRAAVRHADAANERSGTSWTGFNQESASQ